MAYVKTLLSVSKTMRLGPALLLLIATACGGGPSDAELMRLHDEAVRANAEHKANITRGARVGYTLTVSGQIRKPAATLQWPDLQSIGKTEVNTTNIFNVERKTPTRFRGVLVRDLLDRFDASPDAGQITFVAIDGFRATIDVADARAHRILLAIEADGAPIDRTAGGPILLTYPYAEVPDLRKTYDDRFWAFYVAHVVVGTEPPRLVVGDKALDRAALARLPPITMEIPVGWKVDWPADAVRLRGVLLTDAIAAAGVTLPAGGRVVIRGKAPVHDDPDNPIAIAVSDLAACRPVLAMQWGPDDTPIPAKLGGPLAMAVRPCGKTYGGRLWVTFVERIAVVAR